MMEKGTKKMTIVGDMHKEDKEENLRNG